MEHQVQFVVWVIWQALKFCCAEIQIAIKHENCILLMTNFRELFCNCEYDFESTYFSAIWLTLSKCDGEEHFKFRWSFVSPWLLAKDSITNKCSRCAWTLNNHDRKSFLCYSECQSFIKIHYRVSLRCKVENLARKKLNFSREYT